MSLRSPAAKTATALLRENRTLKTLLGAAQRLEQLQRLLEGQLEPAARAHCQVARWADGDLLLLASNAHWASRLHYRQRRLQQALLGLPEFAGLQRIRIKVRPQNEAPAYQPQTVSLPEAGADSLRQSAGHISDPALRAALERLARHARPD